MLCFNAHTHYKDKENEVGLRNNFIQSFTSIKDAQLQSSGIHPWHINTLDIDACLKDLSEVIDQIDAIGECGLDRLIDVDWYYQIEIFRKHIELSEKHQLPLVVHSVRSYPDIIQIKKQSKCTQPWIIHGFVGNTQVARQLISNNCYLSFGKHLMKGHQKTMKALKEVDAQYVFFETDDDPKISIKEVYQQGAKLLDVKIEQLIEEKCQLASKMFPKIKVLL
ncbi:TatD family hydrolase [Flammeovirga pacifica]|uniref:Hydrolase TatD n=1 Tax=Flammeovirga pacifica TaxID=915059 RepID=A0A1S1YZF9_FLAPC|nr:TatD family hydrolase [Flammeovirga pacifica]OHX66255.1 hypothetical protein NH26_07765 [Flammeovirga pacifica]